jgi:hypothetical protein
MTNELTQAIQKPVTQNSIKDIINITLTAGFLLNRSFLISSFLFSRSTLYTFIF